MKRLESTRRHVAASHHRLLPRPALTNVMALFRVQGLGLQCLQGRGRPKGGLIGKPRIPMNLKHGLQPTYEAGPVPLDILSPKL